MCVKVCRGAAGEIVEPRGWALDSCASCIPCGPLTSKNVLALCACRYVALQTLCNVVHDDTSAVQRHKGTIVDCLKVRCAVLWTWTRPQLPCPTPHRAVPRGEDDCKHIRYSEHILPPVLTSAGGYSGAAVDLLLCLSPSRTCHVMTDLRRCAGTGSWGAGPAGTALRFLLLLFTALSVGCVHV